MAHICTVTPISRSVGVNRIVPGVSISSPTGKPELPPEEEKILRRKILETALEALSTEVTEKTIFRINEGRS